MTGKKVKTIQPLAVSRPGPGFLLRRSVVVALVGFLLLAAPHQVRAGDFGLLVTLPALFDQVALLAALVGIVVAVKIFRMVKGGLLAQSWQYFVLGLGCLALAQMAQLADTVGLYASPSLLRPVILTCMALLWTMGIVKTKKSLS